MASIYCMPLFGNQSVKSPCLDSTASCYSLYKLGVYIIANQEGGVQLGNHSQHWSHTCQKKKKKKAGKKEKKEKAKSKKGNKKETKEKKEKRLKKEQERLQKEKDREDTKATKELFNKAKKAHLGKDVLPITV